MKIFGTTPDHRIEIVHLSAQEVVDAGIHPWRVDLFEPHPMTIAKASGLAFSPLRRLSFAYSGRQRVVFGGLHDGHQAICFKAQAQPNDPTKALAPSRWHLALTGILDAHDFRNCLRIYLEQNGSGTRHNVPKIWAAYQGDNWALTAGRVKYRTYKPPCGPGAPMNGAGFFGQMFSPIRIRTPLPPAINWVFDSFKDWHPVVYGECLRDTLDGGTDTDDGFVDFIVDRHEVQVFRDRLLQLGANDIVELSPGESAEQTNPNLMFSHGGRFYYLLSRGNHLADWFWQIVDFSANQVMADCQNTIIASRIALHDIGHHQARLVSALRGHNLAGLQGKWPEQTRRLRQKGFAILTDFFGQYTR